LDEDAEESKSWVQQTKVTANAAKDNVESIADSIMGKVEFKSAGGADC